MTKKKLILRLLSDLMAVVESASEEELAALRRMSLSELSSERSTKPRSHRLETDKKRGLSDAEAERILIRLASADSREEAKNFLEKRELSKPSLEYLARELELPVVREDNTERLIQKIVEGAIGTRLNSVAIHGG